MLTHGIKIGNKYWFYFLIFLFLDEQLSNLNTNQKQTGAELFHALESSLLATY